MFRWLLHYISVFFGWYFKIQRKKSASNFFKNYSFLWDDCEKYLWFEMKFLRIKSVKGQAQWFTELRKLFEQYEFKLYELPETLLDGVVTIAGNGSLSGVQVEAIDDALLLYFLSYPSDLDRKIFNALIKHFKNTEFQTFVDDKKVDFDLVKGDDFELKSEPKFLSRGERKISLLNLQSACIGKSSVARERFMIEAMNNLSVAQGAEMYAVDGLSSFIWDGEVSWIPGKLDQILFSQKSFQGKLCGVVSLEEFQKVLGSRVLSDEFGTLIPDAESMGSSDFKSLNIHMEQFEGARKPTKPEKLSITAGKLEEISYGMTKAIFSGESLQDYNQNLVSNGLSQGQLEVAGLAVSSMLEIAASSQGQSLADMTGELKQKSSLTNEAAQAVASGFFKAAQEEPEKKSLVKSAIISSIVLIVIVWLFYTLLF